MLPVMAQEQQAWFHESAYVDEGAVVGAGTKIWHFCHVLSSARIGKGSVVGQNGYIGKVTIGDGVRIQNNVSVYDGVTLEDNVFVGPSAVFTNVLNPRSEVSRKDEYAPTVVKRGASIGANATIVCGATIGEYAFVGAGAVVRGDVPAYALMLGVPARRRGWMCRCGVRLRVEHDHDEAKCKACGMLYEEAGGVLRPAPAP
jgi:UDP-2-acetamido-3-amino-2,3-dideoxy-glucuronate N-acetyltransferase